MSDKNYYDPNMGGTDNYWKHPLTGLIYTDSVRNFCTEYQAYWILDVVSSWMKRLHGDFYLITLDVDVGRANAQFSVRTDIDQPKMIVQFISYTDLKVSVKLYYENQVLMFPSDH